MEEKPFRVLLDVRDLFSDSIKHIWISISPKETRTILDLKSLLKKKLNLHTKNITLHVGEGLLLDEEAIAVLREDDVIRVEYAEKVKHLSQQSEDSAIGETSSKSDHKKRKSGEPYLNIKKRKKCQNDTESFENDEVEITVSSKPKKSKKDRNDNLEKEEESKISNQSYVTELSSQFEDLSYSNNVNERKKNSKRKHKEKSLSFDQDILNVDCHTDITMSDAALTSNVAKKQKSRKSSEISKYIASFQEDDCDIIASNKAPTQDNHMRLNASAVKAVLDEGKSELVLSNSTPVKRRKRKRKRKSKNLSLSDVIVPLDLPSVVMNGSGTSMCPERKHVIFSPPKHGEKSLVNNPLPIEVIDLEAATSTPIQMKENKALDQDPSLIKTKHLPLPIGEDARQKSFNAMPHSTATTSKEVCDKLNESAILTYDSLPPLSCLPVVGTKIAYKTLELDENYSPVVSDFREGLVKEINQKTDELIIELSKLIVKPGRNGKFELLKEDEIPLPEVIKKEIVSWNALIEPKLIG